MAEENQEGWRVKHPGPERKPAAVRHICTERVIKPEGKPRIQKEDIDDYIFRHVTEPPVSRR